MSGRARIALLFVSLSAFASTACNTGANEPKPEVKPEVKSAASSVPPTQQVGLRIGAPIEPSTEKAALADIAKNPNAFMGKKFATTGTVTAVCLHLGCWMEIKDEASEAHIRMAGHKIFIPRGSKGKKARVLATLVKGDDEPACDNQHPDSSLGSASLVEHETMATSGGGNGPAPSGSAGKGKSCRAEAEAQMGHPLAKLELIAEGVELL